MKQKFFIVDKKAITVYFFVLMLIGSIQGFAKSRNLLISSIITASTLAIRRLWMAVLKVALYYYLIELKDGTKPLNGSVTLLR